MPSPPARSPSVPACPPEWRAAPKGGEHNARVFGDLLELGHAETERLWEAGVIW